MVEGIHLRTLKRALAIAGSKDRLAAMLRVEHARLEEYLDGRAAPPSEVFMRALDIVARGKPGE